ncbi:MAG: methyl-accepting chemotaxis protein [Planctomycetota bacterium]|nr:methyl-accepting chemotaxis protein [Planctomycetota bacterium]
MNGIIEDSSFSKAQIAGLQSFLGLGSDDQAIGQLKSVLNGYEDTLFKDIETRMSQLPDLAGQTSNSRSLLQEYFRQLLDGQIDDHYIQTRRSVGEDYQQNQLGIGWLSTVFAVYYEQIQSLSSNTAKSDKEKKAVQEGLSSLLKRIFFDLSISLDAHFQKSFRERDKENRENALALDKILKALSKAERSDQVIRGVLDCVREEFNWAYGSYWALDEKGESLKFSLESGNVSDEFRQVTQSAAFRKGVGVNGRTWESGRLLVVDDLGAVSDCVRAPVAQLAGIKSGVCFPIKVKGEVVGTMDFFADDEQKMSSNRSLTLENIGQVVSSTLEKILDREREEEGAENAAAVSKVLERIGFAKSLEGSIRAALDSVRESFGWAYGSYWALDESGEALAFQQESGNVSDEFRQVTQSAAFRKGVGVSGRTWESGRLLVVEDLGAVSDCVRAPVAQLAGVKSGVCFPIFVRGKVSGTMDFFALERFDLSLERRQALENVARLVSANIEKTSDRAAFANSLSSFSDELSSMSLDLKATTAEQSAASQELATSVSQVTATLSEVRQASVDALQKAEMVIRSAEDSIETSNEGSSAVEAAVKSMREIREQVSEIAERILTLSDQTSQIGDIISSVNEIAAQSKLLALNAAIEAARAGEHGKGFAVVATEIRSLSDQSKDATAQVKDILGEIQGGTNSAVVSAEEGTKKVAMGMDLADASGQNIHKLASAIEKSAESARLIANSARQQNAGIEQVAEAMTAITQASSNAVSGVRQTDQAAEQLVSLGKKMAELLSMFSDN